MSHHIYTASSGVQNQKISKITLKLFCGLLQTYLKKEKNNLPPPFDNKTRAEGPKHSAAKCRQDFPVLWVLLHVALSFLTCHRGV